ncbi:glycosyltransferase [Novosphingobium sp. BW1]|uniref:glycosyltransferase n=1 Tax=Novosphingobium sp. BW1 TaxID=2592621 RepID=UPI001F077B12|nr:glycosyltransferase [Novosphingobium sp. BW1]
MRLLIDAARRIDPDLTLVNRNPWQGIEDKSTVRGLWARLRIAWAWLASYPLLIFAYLRMPRHDIVLVPYLGNLDVVLLLPFARLRGARICWDMFISLYDTIVIDRKLLPEGSWRARALYHFERASVRLADKVLMDTRAHAAYVRDLYKAPPNKLSSVWVGAETALFRPTPMPARSGPVEVLFYGQFIALHGLETLIDAIDLIEASPPRGDGLACRFTIVGTGQEAAAIDARIARQGLRNLRRIDWVDYTELPDLIATSDICLGIFAGEGKAGRVIPNKMFQILASGRALITRDSPAARELVEPGAAIRLVRPADPRALAEEVVALARDLRDPVRGPHVAAHAAKMPAVDEKLVARQLASCLRSLLQGHAAGP